MNTVEAISLLTECKPLCKKLNVMGLNCTLDEADLVSLQGFGRVFKSGLGYNEQVLRAAGLGRYHVGLLNFVLACHR
jgi:hypothetical protein